MKNSTIEQLYDTAVRFVYSHGKFDRELLRKALQIDEATLTDLITMMIENGAISPAGSNGTHTPSKDYIHSDYLLKKELAEDALLNKKKQSHKRKIGYLKIMPVIAFMVFLVTCFFAFREMVTLLFIIPTCLLCFWFGEKIKAGQGVVSFLIIVVCIISLAYVNSLTPIFGVEYAQRAESEKIMEAAKRSDNAAERERIIAIDNAEQSIKHALKDPDSAKFSSSRLSKSGAVCGYVNAKNSFGAYAGNSRYIYVNGSSTMDDGSQEFSDVWDKICN